MDGETTREGEGENEIRNYVGLRGEGYVCRSRDIRNEVTGA